jgi:hypothetical protein
VSEKPKSRLPGLLRAAKRIGGIILISLAALYVWRGGKARE